MVSTISIFTYVLLRFGITIDCERCSAIARSCARKSRTTTRVQKRKAEVASVAHCCSRTNSAGRRPNAVCRGRWPAFIPVRRNYSRNLIGPLTYGLPRS